ncbi:MAG: winged helix-turn-helix transcriptional regulator, partial [Candidatus Diapherotrites archaeon]|nr:winged helix-turn-helix transcriptional regulator [Candidatus Diapherotrites archaeon]
LEITPPLTPPSYPPIRVTELEAKILNLLAKNPRTSRTELANSLGIKIDTIKEYLQRLKKKGILTRKGGAQKGYWEVRQ